MWHRPMEVRSAVASVGLAPVAQLDRAGGFYPSGCGFDSCRGRRCPDGAGVRSRCPAAIPLPGDMSYPDAIESVPTSALSSVASRGQPTGHAGPDCRSASGPGGYRPVWSAVCSCPWPSVALTATVPLHPPAPSRAPGPWPDPVSVVNPLQLDRNLVDRPAARRRPAHRPLVADVADLDGSRRWWWGTAEGLSTPTTWPAAPRRAPRSPDGRPPTRAGRSTRPRRSTRSGTGGPAVLVGSGNDADPTTGGYQAYGPSGGQLWFTPVVNPPTDTRSGRRGPGRDRPSGRSRPADLTPWPVRSARSPTPSTPPPGPR